MNTPRKMTMWLMGMAIGAGIAAIPATATAQAPAAGAVPEEVKNADVPKAVKDGFHDRFKQGTNAKYLRLAQGGQTYWVVLFNRGEDGPRAEAILSDAGQVLEGPIAARPADAARTVGAAGAAPAPRALDVKPTGSLEELNKQVETYKQVVQGERAELQREQARADEAMAKLKQDVSKLNDEQRKQFMTEVASIEEQAAHREKQALERAQLAEQDLAAFRGQLANKDLPADRRAPMQQLETLAADRLTINREIMRIANSYQVAMDRFDLPGGAAQPAAAGSGVTREVVEAAALPPAVKQTFDRQTGGSKVTGYAKLVNNGRVYYSAHYALNGRNYLVRVNEAGQIVRGPMIVDGNGEARPAAARDLGERVAGNQLPKAVQETVEQRLPGKNHYFYRAGDGFRVFYTAVDGKWMSARLDKEGKVTAGPEAIDRPPAEVRGEGDFKGAQPK